MKPAIGKFVTIAGLAAPLLFGLAVGRAPAQQSAAPVVAGPWPNMYKSPLGYSISYPNGWKIGTQRQMEAIRQSARANFHNDETELDQNWLFVYDPLTPRPTDNLNVIVTRQPLNINWFTEEQMRSQIERVGEQQGSRPENFTIETQTVDGRRVIVARYDIKMLGNPLSIKQVAVPDGGRQLMITCTALHGRWPQEEPVFDAMVKSIAASLPPDANPFSGSRSKSLGEMVGVLIGVLLLFFFAMARNRNNRSYPPGGYGQPPGSQQSEYQPPPWPQQPPPGGHQQSPWPVQQPPAGQQPPPGPPRQPGQWPPQQ